MPKNQQDAIGSNQDALDALEYRVRELRLGDTGRTTAIFPEDEIIRMEARVIVILSELRYIRNLRQPINTIPDEIMSEIMEMATCKNRYSEDDHYGDFPWNPEGLKSVMSVCRRWRQIAVDNALLWTDVDFTLTSPHALERLESSLARSKGALISVSMCGPPSESNLTATALELTKVVAKHSGRIQTLGISIQQESGTAALIREHPFPALTDLTITGPGAGTMGRSLVDAFPFGLPSLKVLYMGFFTSWRPGTFANLTHLHLVSGMGGVGLQYTYVPLTVFLDLLELSPMMEDIETHEYGPQSGGMVPDRVVPLLHLRRAELWHTDGRAVLACIRVSPSAHVGVHGQLWSDLDHRVPEDTEFHPFFTTVPRDLTRFGFADAYDMTLQIGESTEIDIRSKQGVLTVHEYCESNPNLNHFEALILSLILQSIGNYGVLPTVEDFTVQREAPDDSQEEIIWWLASSEWEVCFRQLPNLETLTVRDFVGAGTLHALASGILPNLTQLNLGIYETSVSSESVVRTLQACINMVEARSGAGVPLEELSIEFRRRRSLGADSELIARLKEQLLELEGRHVETITFSTSLM